MTSEAIPSKEFNMSTQDVMEKPLLKLEVSDETIFFPPFATFYRAGPLRLRDNPYQSISHAGSARTHCRE
jgi:hypothetical protein